MKAQIAAIRVNGKTQVFKVPEPLPYEELLNIVKDEYPKSSSYCVLLVLGENK